MRGSKRSNWMLGGSKILYVFLFVVVNLNLYLFVKQKIKKCNKKMTKKIYNQKFRYTAIGESKWLKVLPRVEIGSIEKIIGVYLSNEYN